MPEPIDNERELFMEALDLKDPAHQQAFLAGACRGDTAKLDRIRSLLGAHQQAGNFLQGEDPSPCDDLKEGAAEVPLSEAPGSVVGRYRLQEKIGEGGFGVVYMAEQREPVRRRVALKVIKLGMDTREVVARFEAERQALAMMNHPNIAKVLDGGATDTGRPYFVMELVKGVSLTEYCDANRLSVHQRLKLFSQVCDAIHHAHQKGVIHRDIKPSNVLVATQDDVAVPKVIDFGVAKATQYELTEKTIFTRQQQWVGTPTYMSPEQAQFSGLDIDTRTDIYSLGVLLYELLTGRTPFPPEELLQAGYDGMRQMIREREPVKPSTWIKSLSTEELERLLASYQGEGSRFLSRVKGDLDCIILKALEKDRTRRYASAAALGEDIQRHLRHEPITAAPPSLTYQLGKYARRNRLALTAVGAVVLSLVLGTIVSATQAYRATRAQERANEEAATAAAVNRFLNAEFFAVADPMNEPDRNIKLRDLLARASRRFDDHFEGPPLVEASIRHIMAGIHLNLGEYGPAAKHARQAVEIRARTLGELNPETLRSRTLLAATIYRQGEYAEAEGALEGLLQTARDELGEENSLTMEIMYWLAQACLSNSRGDPAEALLKRMLELEPILPRRHWLRAGLVATQGWLYEFYARYGESEQLYSIWLDENKDQFGDEHPYALNLKQRLAYAYEWQDKQQQADDLYHEVVQTKQRVLGPEHPSTLSSMAELANHWIREKKFDEAETLLKQVLEGRRKVLGETHPATRWTVIVFNGLYRGAQDHATNRRFMRDVLRRDPNNSYALDCLGQYLDLDSLRMVLSDSEHKAEAWRYTTTEPGPAWTQSRFDDRTWQQGKGIFGNSEYLPMATPWNTRSIRLRREFNLDQVPPENLVVRVMHDDHVKVYINGELAVDRMGWTGRHYRLIFATDKAKRALKPGRNVLAILCQNVSLEGVIDAGLYFEQPGKSLMEDE